jgi:hypothetical protein
LAVKLLFAATGETLTAEMATALARLAPTTVAVGPVVAQLSREDFVGGIPGGYTLTLALAPQDRSSPA